MPTTIGSVVPFPSDEKPLRADARRNLERVLRAAEEVFGEHGPAGQMDDVAKRAGVGVGTIYRRFASKESLVQEVLVSRLQELLDLGRRALDDGDPWHGLSVFVREVASRVVGFRTLADLVVKRGAAEHGPHEASLTHAFEELTGVIKALLDRAQSAGVVRSDVGVGDLVALLAAFAHLRPERDGGLTTAAARSRQVGIFLDGLRREAASPLPGRPAPVSHFKHRHDAVT